MTAPIKPRKITATAENGEVFTRRTARTYTHACYLEFTYSDGTVSNSDASWAGRPDLAEKNLKQGRESAARLQGTEVTHWDKEKRVYIGTGIFRTKVRAVTVPVNA
tara:strand:- start:66 stop:383 length:318 start_codon:yes stop_codon:yes gene_type:complete